MLSRNCAFSGMRQVVTQATIETASDLGGKKLLKDFINNNLNSHRSIIFFFKSIILFMDWGPFSFLPVIRPVPLLNTGIEQTCDWFRQFTSPCFNAFGGSRSQPIALPGLSCFRVSVTSQGLMLRKEKCWLLLWLAALIAITLL